MNNTIISYPAAQLHRLIRRCNDASFAFSIGADHVADAFLRAKFKAYAADRETCARELEELASAMGEPVSEEHSNAQPLHGSDWTTLASAVAANDTPAILAECSKRDDAVLQACIDILDDVELDPVARAIVLRQYHAIEETTAA